MLILIRLLFGVTLYVTILTVTGHATQLNGINFAERVSEKDVQLVLNGVGVRTYLFVDVYVAGLYLSEKKSETEDILNLQSTKLIRMHYFRDISKEDMNKVWKHSIEQACKPNCSGFENTFEEFYNASFDIKKGTEVTYIFTPQFVEIRSLNKVYKIIKDNFDDILLKTWIGNNPPTQKLKSGLLGKK